MATNILVTKLYAPLPRRNLVPRPRLIEQLRLELVQERAFSRKFSLICAPAGYGKTTLAVTWVQQAGVPFVWLSLDEHDNDPAHFLACLMSALSKVQPGLAGEGSPGGQGLGAAALEMMLTFLVNAIAAAPAPFILVMDDYHVIHTVAVHRLLGFLLENMPPCMHLLIVSREDPPLPLPRLRAAGQVVEIRQADLSFNREEVADFFHRSVAVKLNTEDLDSLIQRTEGWAVGLQMVALSLQSGIRLPDLLRFFTGSHRFIMDYLMDEVFNKLPDHLQDFLLKCSILDRFSAPLCDAVTGGDDGAEILSRLEAVNAFIIPLDPVREWYRFHHLLTELLRQKLRQSRDIAEQDLHRAAGEWLHQHGYPREAMKHALAGADWERVAEWLHPAANEMLRQGEILNLLGWYAQIPEAQIFQHPRIALDYCWPLILSGQLDKAEYLLDQAGQCADLSREEQGNAAAARAYIARSRGDGPKTMEWSQKALALLPKEGSQTRGLLATNLGIAFWHTGQLDEAERMMLDALGAYGSTENHYAVLTSQIFLNRVMAARGQLRGAFARYQPLREMTGPIPILALAHMDIASLHYEWNELDACAAHLEQSIAIAERTRSAEFQSSACNQLARLRLAQRDEESAWEALRRARQLLENQAVTPLTWARSAAAFVQMALLQGDITEAEHWVELAGERADAHPFYPFAGLSRARLLLAKNQLAVAQEELEKCAQQAVHNHWGYARVEILVLQALAFSQISSAPDEALAFLKEALALAQPEGFLRTFADAGAPLVPLLYEAARRGVFPEYAGQVTALIQQEPGIKCQSLPGKAVLEEALTERELEVLRLVAAGLPNKQIADQLVVSLSTVKSHVHHISGKLGSENRMQLVARAREFGLL